MSKQARPWTDARAYPVSSQLNSRASVALSRSAPLRRRSGRRRAAQERAIIERYKRGLFGQRAGARARSLKDELYRLLSGSRELVDLNNGGGSAGAAMLAALPVGPGSHLVLGAGRGEGEGEARAGGGGGGSGTFGWHAPLPALGADGGGGGPLAQHAAAAAAALSYERLQQMIENVLSETGYYGSFAPAARGQPAARTTAADLRQAPPSAPASIFSLSAPDARAGRAGAGRDGTGNGNGETTQLLACTRERTSSLGAQQSSPRALGALSALASVGGASLGGAVGASLSGSASASQLTLGGGGGGGGAVGGSSKLSGGGTPSRRPTARRSLSQSTGSVVLPPALVSQSSHGNLGGGAVE
jgi:hypothetical protein